MFEELVEILKQMAEMNISEQPIFRTIVMLRDGLVESGMHPDTAGDIATRMKIVISSNYTDEELRSVVDPMVDFIVKSSDAFFDEEFTSEQFIKMSEEFSLELP